MVMTPFSFAWKADRKNRLDGNCKHRKNRHQTEMNEVHGRCEPWLAGRQESFQDSRVGALTSKGRSAKTFPESFRGVDVAHGFFI